jgi:hypothetical protein
MSHPFYNLTCLLDGFFFIVSNPCFIFVSSISRLIRMMDLEIVPIVFPLNSTTWPLLDCKDEVVASRIQIS